MIRRLRIVLFSALLAMPVAGVVAAGSAVGAGRAVVRAGFGFGAGVLSAG